MYCCTASPVKRLRRTANASPAPLPSPYTRLYAEEVKAIGDALMLYAHTPAPAVELGLRIVEDVGSRHYFPVVRVGMHTGEAVEREGNWFGAAVNLAARVSAAAAGSEALLTSATRDAAGTLARLNANQRAEVAHAIFDLF